VFTPAYGACFAAPWGGIASLSPELFLRRRGRVVSTGPIKGTAPRSADPGALRASAKDRAEHVMIVDLMRNDLGRVCEYGSIVAAETPEAQAHPGVWHLVSELRGRLRDVAGDGALLRATFPPGSVTGAPKVQALRVISELEATGREVYTGAIGFASPLAGLELSVAIRTFGARDGRLWLGVGGGIVADSDPLLELEECLVKARQLVAPVGGRIATGRARSSSRR
jgi:para-aminobenzoate synthetase / 4-amino-4-deoxychorismate lyase